jgi:hypothetical protein
VALVFSLAVGAGTARAGADASEDATASFRVDLSRRFEVYGMTNRDRAWSRSLTRKLRYTGEVVHFVRTSLPLEVDGKTVDGAVYQALEEPGYFYVAVGDATLRVGAPCPYSPGVGGFSIARAEVEELHRHPPLPARRSPLPVEHARRPRRGPVEGRVVSPARAGVARRPARRARVC